MQIEGGGSLVEVLNSNRDLMIHAVEKLIADINVAIILLSFEY